MKLPQVTDLGGTEEGPDILELGDTEDAAGAAVERYYKKLDPPSGTTYGFKEIKFWIEDETLDFESIGLKDESRRFPVTEQEKIPVLEKMHELQSEADMSRAAMLYLINPVNVAFAEWLEQGHAGAGTTALCRTEEQMPTSHVAGSNTKKGRSDVGWTLIRDGEPTNLAILEFKAPHSIVYEHFEAARYEHEQRDEAMADIAELGGASKFEDNSLWIMKQLTRYAVEADTCYVGVFDWKTMILFCFNEMLQRQDGQEEEADVDDHDPTGSQAYQEPGEPPEDADSPGGNAALGISYNEAPNDPVACFRAALLGFLISAALHPDGPGGGDEEDGAAPKRDKSGLSGTGKEGEGSGASRGNDKGTGRKGKEKQKEGDTIVVGGTRQDGQNDQANGPTKTRPGGPTGKPGATPPTKPGTTPKTKPGTTTKGKPDRTKTKPTPTQQTKTKPKNKLIPKKPPTKPPKNKITRK